MNEAYLCLSACGVTRSSFAALQALSARSWSVVGENGEHSETPNTSSSRRRPVQLAERVQGAPQWTRGCSLATTLLVWLEQR